MALSVLSYSADAYNSLPNIMDAGDSLKPKDIGHLTKEIGQVFIKHNVEKLFGIILLHNHFSLEEDEMLVNIGFVAVPWKTSSHAQQTDDVRGSAWAFTKDGVIPYEFTYHEAPEPEINHFQPFISDLSTTLDLLDLTGKLGLCALTGDDQNSSTRMEFTQGRANITLPFDISPEEGKSNSIEAVWQFDSSPYSEASPAPIILKKCKVACKTEPNTGHRGDHKTTTF